MNNEEISKELLKHLGGKENIVTNICCMTRLRVGVRDRSKVDIEALKKVDGVKGVVENETMQVVIGPGKVNKILEEFSKLTGIVPGERAKETPETPDKHIETMKVTKKTPARDFMKKIANIFVALMPGTVAAGLIVGLFNVINVATGDAFANVWWYQTIRSMGWVMYAYLPILVGYNTAKEFGGSGVLGAIAGMMCIYNAGMPLLAKGAADSASAILLPFTHAEYNPAAGGLIAAMIGAALFAVLERKIRKHMPSILDTVFSPMLVLVIGAFAITLIIQPASALFTSGIYGVLSFIYEEMGIFGGYLLSAGLLPMVSVGLHQALTPIHAMLNDPNGATKGINYLLPILMMAGGGQVGAGLALYFKTKNKKLKKFAAESIPVGILGIGEPLMYAVTLPLVRPFVTACLGAGVGGALAAFFHLGAVSQGVSGLFGLLIVVPGQQLTFAFCMLVSYIAGFILTWFFGVNEERINEFYGE